MTLGWPCGHAPPAPGLERNGRTLGRIFAGQRSAGNLPKPLPPPMSLARLLATLGDRNILQPLNTAALGITLGRGLLLSGTIGTVIALLVLMRLRLVRGVGTPAARVLPKGYGPARQVTGRDGPAIPAGAKRGAARTGCGLPGSDPRNAALPHADDDHGPHALRIIPSDVGIVSERSHPATVAPGPCHCDRTVQKCPWISLLSPVKPRTNARRAAVMQDRHRMKAMPPPCTACGAI